MFLFSLIFRDQIVEEKKNRKNVNQFNSASKNEQRRINGNSGRIKYITMYIHLTGSFTLQHVREEIRVLFQILYIIKEG